MPSAPEIARLRKRDLDRLRGSSYARGYDRQWSRVRSLKLQADPLCECVECQAGKIRMRAATVVHHIIPIAKRPDLRLDMANLMSLAKPCHDRITAEQDGFNRGKPGKVAPHPSWDEG